MPSHSKVNVSTLLPASLETLRIVYPQANVVVWLQDLFRGPTIVHNTNIRKIELVCSKDFNAKELVLRVFHGQR